MLDTAETISLQETGFSYDDTICHCPVCENDNVHLQSVEVNAGGVVTAINNQHPTVTERSAQGRGTSILIRYWAECGHSWTRQIYFHKGQTMELLYKSASSEQTDMWRE